MVSEWLNPTRAVGLGAYTVSTLVCALALARVHRLRSRAIVLWIGGVQLALVADMAFDGRWKFHDLWMREAQALGLYGDRRWPQLVALVILCVAVVFAAFQVRRRYRDRPGLALAATGTISSIGLWCCESLSYHYMDLILYRTIGGAMLVCLFWVTCALATSIGICLEAFS